jgi:hypothetical protein
MSSGLGGYDECLKLPCQPSEQRKHYLKIMGRDVRLFRRKEKKCKRERDRFLKRVKQASKHLLDVYYRDRSGLEAEEFNLSQHPSHEMKDLANRVYSLLEQQKCHCAQRASRLSGAREARLSLVRHRLLPPKLPSQVITVQSHLPAKFEVLLPVCNQSVWWKVTNIEVINKTR